MSDAPLTWDAGTIDGTPWQGIRYLSIDLREGVPEPAVVTVHLNQPAGSLSPDHVVVRGGRRLPVPPYDVEIGGTTVTISFHGLGDHSPYTVELQDGGGTPLHPFFASAEFRFTIDCETGDCRVSPNAAQRAIAQAPAVDLLTKDFNGFVSLLADWVSVRNPRIVDLSTAAFERLMLDLLAWAGDLQSYHQDRVANEAFVETASQRFSLRQHAVLLGTRLDDGRAPSTLLSFDVETSGFVPAGLQVRMRTSSDEVPVSYVTASRTRVFAENSSVRLSIAAFSGADDAELPAGATEALLWGHDMQLAAGDRLAFVQSAFSQVVTVASTPERIEAPGWVQHPADPFTPGADPAAKVTRVRWSEPLAQPLRPWADPPLELHANLVDAVYGTPRAARVANGGPATRGVIDIPLTRRTSVVTRRRLGEGRLLRALRVPEWPVVHDDDGTGIGIPAVELTVSHERWTRVDHLLNSRSYDLHFTAEADEEGAVWLRFGDGVNGHEIILDPAIRPEIELAYRIGDPVAGNVGLGTLVDVVPPDERGPAGTAFHGLGVVAVTNVVPGSGGREPHTLARIKEELPASLHHGPLQRAVSLDDYATVAMDVPGVARATARARGGLFNTVLVLVDPEGSGDLDERLRQRVADYLDGLRMTGREHVVLAAEYVPLEVELELCANPGFAGNVVRDRVLAELRPGTADRPGYFHPDRLSFGDVVRLGDLIAFVQEIPGVRSVRAVTFRPLGDTVGPQVRDVIVLGRTKVARLDADPDFPEHGTLVVTVAGFDVDADRPAVGFRRITHVSRRRRGSPQHRIVAVGGTFPDGTAWRMPTSEAVAAIRRGERFFVDHPRGDVDVEIGRTKEGHHYLRSVADKELPNNLLSLPELPDE